MLSIPNVEGICNQNCRGSKLLHTANRRRNIWKNNQRSFADDDVFTFLLLLFSLLLLQASHFFVVFFSHLRASESSAVRFNRIALLMRWLKTEYFQRFRHKTQLQRFKWISIIFWFFYINYFLIFLINLISRAVR